MKNGLHRRWRAVLCIGVLVLAAAPVPICECAKALSRRRSAPEEEEEPSFVTARPRQRAGRK